MLHYLCDYLTPRNPDYRCSPKYWLLVQEDCRETASVLVRQRALKRDTHGEVKTMSCFHRSKEAFAKCLMERAQRNHGGRSTHTIRQTSNRQGGSRPRRRVTGTHGDDLVTHNWTIPRDTAVGLGVLDHPASGFLANADGLLQLMPLYSPHTAQDH